MSTAETKIQWTDRTWNPVRGCARVSPGCEHCYAERVAYRFNGEGQPYEGLTVLGKKGPRWSGEARFIPSALGEPSKWRKPQRIFVNSMSDLFHDDVTNEQIAAVFGVMAACPQHTFQVLTKRPARMVEWFQWVSGKPGFSNPLQACCMSALDFEREHHSRGDAGPLHIDRCADPEGPWPLPNVHLGVSCENQETANKRIPVLLQTPAALRFISAEPLLGPVNLTEVGVTLCRDALRVDCEKQGLWHAERHLDWVIVGGESGSGARPCSSDWIVDIVGQCRRADIACFVKQLGSYAFGHSNIRLKDRKGGDITEWPPELQVRQMPRRAARDAAE